MVYLIIGLIFGTICAVIASGKGRSPIGWFAIGFLIPLIGLILILVLPKGDGGLVNAVPMEMPPNFGAAAPAPAAPHNASIDALQKLAELKERGVLTEEEFEEKKRELLSRV